MLWNSVLQACLQACSKIPSLVWVLLAHRQLVQLVHNHALACWRAKAEFHPIAVFRFLGCQIKTGYICTIIGSGFRVMFAFLVIQRPQQLEKPFLSSPGHNPFQSLVTVSFFIGNSSLLSLYFSWHSFVRWRAMFVLDYEILGMRSLRVFQLSFAHALTRGASLVAASPRPNATALGSCEGPRRGGPAASEVRRLRGGEGQRRSQTPELSQPRELCRGEEQMPFTCLQHLSKWILFLSLHDMILLI